MEENRFTNLLTASISLSACGNSESDRVEQVIEDETIELTYVNWDTELASTHVVGEVLERLGYDVILTSVESPIMWQSIATGEADAMVGAWLPYTHEWEYERHKDDIVSLGKKYEDALIGLIVPDYTEDLNSIEDLDQQIEDQTIVGIERGAGIVEAAERALEDYGKEEWEVLASSSGAMVIELRQAISNQEPIIVTGWTPHWKFIEFDLKMLDEPKNSFGESEYIEPLSEKALSKTIQLLLRSWKTFTWEQEEFESVMLEINEGVSEEEAAENFVDNNPNLVKEWLDGVVETAEESAENTGDLETIESNE